jgi:hypothetical protein
MDWAPSRYESSWGKSNTGTAGATGFGANFHKIVDDTKNVSWVLFTDMHLLADYDDNAPDGQTFLTDPEACPRPCYRWFKEYATQETTAIDELHADTSHRIAAYYSIDGRKLAAPQRGVNIVKVTENNGKTKTLKVCYK